MTTGPHEDAFRSRWTPDADIPLSGVPVGATWRRARNLASGEAVILFTVQGHAALEVADAARRAYLVEDPRLMPVQDVHLFGDPREDEGAEGTEGDADLEPLAVVEYPVPPAAPLAALFADGPLRGETARSIIGEIAAGLDVARRRGIRHQNLDSNRVFVDPSAGTVHILGVGVEAAARTEEFATGRVASFRDTTSLVALLYKALTGMRPVRERDGLVPRASTVSPRRVPEDLDLLCDVVLNETADEIPETVRDLAAELGPWQSIPVTLEAYDPQDAEIAASRDREKAAAADGAPRAEPTDAEAGSEAPEAEPAEEAPDAQVESTQHSEGADPEATKEADGADPEATVALRPIGGDEHIDPIEGGTLEQETIGGEQKTVEGERGSDEDPSRPGGAVGLAGASALATGGAVAGAAAVGASQVEPSVGTSQADISADASPDETSTEASPVASTVAPQGHNAAAEGPSSPSDPAPTSGGDSGDQARTLIRELHLDERRRGSAFPGHLDVRPTAPATDSDVSADVDPDESPDPERAATFASVPPADDEPRTAPMAPIIAGAGVLAIGGDAASAPGAPSRERSGTSEDGGVPSQDASTGPEQPTVQHAPVRPAASAVAATAISAPTPSPAEDSEVVEDPAGDGAASPAGAAPEVSGPIVIHGRDRSLTEAEAAEAEPGRGSLLRDVVGVAMDRDEPNAYTQAPVQREERSRTAQWVLAAAVLLVIIALVFAITSITSTVRGGGSAPVGSTAEETSAPPEEEPEAEDSPAEEDAEELPAPTPASAEIFHRGSDRDPDHTEEAGNLTDGDDGSTWRTKIYSNPQYGGLKEGTGIRISFEEPGTLTSLVVTTAESTGGALELRSAGEGEELGEVLATGEFAGDGEVTLTPEAPLTEVDSVVIWVPELPEDPGADGFRAHIAEVRAE